MTDQTGSSTWTRIGRAITRTRNFVINAIFLLLLLTFVVALFSDNTPEVPDGSALLVNPRGNLVEQRSVTDPLARLLAPDAPGEVELSELTDTFRRAATDDRIVLAVLDLDELGGISASHAVAIGDAIREFQEQGKQVTAYGASFSQSQYLIASYADAVYMHPMGQLLLTGYGSNRLYFSQLLDYLDVNMHIFRVGKYKEFVEPYTRSDMSDEARLANQSLVDELWLFYANQVIANRQLEPGAFERFTQALPEQLAQMADLPTVAVEHHLVDELLSHDAVRARIAREVGYGEDGEFKHVDLGDYLLAAPAEPRSGAAPAIAVITAEGAIMGGRQTQGVIASDTMVGLIRQARQNEDIHALVLQVNSPGGSAFASEIIRQELELLQVTGKPVVVSMGNVAASGGYWIAATADRILAHPTTITGSIGVFGLFPTFENSLARVGVSTDGVGTTPLSRSLDPFAGLSEDMATILQLNVERTYEQFLNLVARGRDMDPAAVDEVAQGRVWTGRSAEALGLVDGLGGVGEAIELAAELAELEDYGVERLRPALTPRDLLMRSLGQIRGELVPPAVRSHALWSELTGLADLLEVFSDPADSYALCEICLSPGLR